MSPSTPVARRARRGLSRRSARPGLRIAAGGLALAGGALLATAVPALAAPSKSDSAGADDTATSRASTDPAAIDGETPTPAPQGAQYGAEPETVLLGVPLEGTLDSVQRATSILPGSGPGDYA